MEEQAICAYVADVIRQLGVNPILREVTPGRNNIYACIPGAGDGRGLSLMLHAHLDTIPVGDCGLFRREGDIVYGRGASDMKGGLAAMLGAVKAVLDTGTRLSGDLWLTTVVGHEGTQAAKDGPRTLIGDIRSGDLACDRILIGEGENELWIMSLGSMVFTITLTSKRGGVHTTHVPFEKNPIRSLGDIIARTTAFQKELNSATPHPLAGHERIDIGIVRAGDYFNRTPVHSTLTGTRRWSPGRNADEILDELQTLFTPLAVLSESECTVSMEHQREPFEISSGDPVVQAVSDAHRSIFGSSPKLVGKAIVADASLYTNEAGIPSLYYGAGSNTAHSDAEWVSLRTIIETAQVYALAAKQFCGIASEQ
jgi:acetylornithine deacetylase